MKFFVLFYGSIFLFMIYLTSSDGDYATFLNPLSLLVIITMVYVLIGRRAWGRLFSPPSELKLGYRYFLVSALVSVFVTIGWLVCHKWTEYSNIGVLFFMVPLVLTKQTKTASKAMNLFSYAIPIAFVLVLIILGILYLPDGKFRGLFGTWYFALAFWLFCQGMLVLRYLKDRESLLSNVENVGQDSKNDLRFGFWDIFDTKE